MNEESLKLLFFPPKSLSKALLFSICLGPIGLLYSSVIGGIVLGMLLFVALSGKFWVASAIFWVFSSYWGVISVNYYNRKSYQRHIITQ
jgi:hypothetical protein